MKFSILTVLSIISSAQALNLLEALNTRDDCKLLLASGFTNNIETLLTNATAYTTIFAPIDSAFPNSVISEKNETNSKIFSYHVIPNKFKEEVGRFNLETSLPLNGANRNQVMLVTVNKAPNSDTLKRIKINDNVDVIGGLAADNGFIYFVNSVITPPSNFSTVAASQNLTDFLTALETEKLTETISNGKGITIFAPTNAAFELFFSNATDSGIKIQEKTSVKHVLNYHIIDSVVYSTEIIAAKENTTLPTLLGGSLRLTADKTAIKVNGSNNAVNVTLVDVLIDNGVIHVVDAVLVPGEKDIENSGMKVGLSMALAMAMSCFLML